MMPYLDEVKQILAENPSLNLSGHFYPCSKEEVVELERLIGFKLPLAYKEFLFWSGKGLGSFEIGSEFYYDQDLIDLQRMAKDLLTDNNAPFELPDDAFVFWGHQGYQFAFFRASEGDNPPIHYYIEAGEGEKEEIKWNYQAHFTDFLITEMRDQARHIENARRIEDEIARDWTRG
jgi:hypothetical protein